MLEKPDIDESIIIRCLAENYDLDISTLTFLPLGADRNTIVYQAAAANGPAYFVKLRRGDFLEASVTVPKRLHALGVAQIIVSHETQKGELWTPFDEYKLTVYPFVEGQNGFEIPLSAEQRVELGAVLKQLHAMSLSPALIANVPREDFSAEWREKVKRFLIRFEHERFQDPITQELAVFINSKGDELLTLINKVEQLLVAIQADSEEYVLCHADIHGWNLLIEETGKMYVIDWDTLILAPKERDLMFVGCGLGGRGQTLAEETKLFYQGYGQVPLNQAALAYYRYERFIQDVSEFCEHLLHSEGDGEDRVWALKTLKLNFEPENTLDLARQLDQSEITK